MLIGLAFPNSDNFSELTLLDEGFSLFLQLEAVLDRVSMLPMVPIVFVFVTFPSRILGGYRPGETLGCLDC